MKRITAILASVMLIFAMAMPAFAEGYVESITAKPAPGVVGDENNVIGHLVDENGNIIADITEGDLDITPVGEADTLPEDAKNALLDVYDKIADGTMEYSDGIKDILGDNIVAKDLFDITATSDDIIAHLKDGGFIRFMLDANIGADEAVAVATFVNGAWEAAVECINNGDGTITLVMSKLGPVGIFVKGEETEPVEPGTTTEPTDPTITEPTDGVCKICHGFFPYLGAAPIFDGVCIICFVLIVIAICAVAYIVYRTTKKDKKEEQK